MEYTQNFLAHVIFQINYSRIDALKSELHSEVYKIANSLTNSPNIKTSNTSVTLLPDNKHSIEVLNVYTFRNNELQITIQTETLQIVTFKYTDHVNFHDIILKVFNAFNSVYKPVINRIALRYINQINFPSGAWHDYKEYINNELLASTMVFKDNEKIARSLGNMMLLDNDNEVITNFIFGFYNSEFPNAIAKREFTLDFDCYVKRQGIIEVPTLLKNLKTKANELFNKSILPAFKELMKGEPNNER